MSIPYPTQVKTVDKFGISARGSQGQGPIRQPVVKYRYRVLFLGFGGAGNTAEPLTLNCNTCSMPKLSHETVTVHSYNSQAYFAGKHSWDPISMVVRDTVDNTVVKTLGAQLQLQLDHYNQTGYRAGQDYKFTTQIQILDGGHDTGNRAWTLEGCFLTGATFGELDYSASDIVTINLDIRYDNAILETLEGINSVFPAIDANPLGTLLNT